MEDISSRHTLGSQKYIISIDNEDDAHGIHSSVSILQDTAVRKTIERVLNIYNNPDVVNQFSQVELDLGLIRKGDFDTELVNRIEEQLTLFFANRIDDRGRLRGGVRKTLQHSTLEKLGYFLVNGHHRWDTLDKATPQEMLSKLSSEKPEALSELLKRIGKSESVRKRLVYQFEDVALEGVVSLVRPQEADVIISSKRRVLNAYRGKPIAGVEPDNMRKALWEVILAYIFAESRSFIDKKSFLRLLIARVASRFNFTYSQLLSKLIKGVGNDREGRAEFKELILELGKGIDANVVQSETGIYEDFTDSSILLQVLDNYLKTGILSPHQGEYLSADKIKSWLHFQLKSKNRQVVDYLTKWIYHKPAYTGLVKLINLKVFQSYFAMKPSFGFRVSQEILESSKGLKDHDIKVVTDWIKRHETKLLLLVLNKGTTSKREILWIFLDQVGSVFYGQQKLFKLWLNAFKQSLENTPAEDEVIDIIGKFMADLDQGKLIVDSSFQFRDYAVILNELKRYPKSLSRNDIDRLKKSLEEWYYKSGLQVTVFYPELVKILKAENIPVHQEILAFANRMQELKHTVSSVIREVVGYFQMNEEELWSSWLLQKVSIWSRQFGIGETALLKEIGVNLKMEGHPLEMVYTINRLANSKLNAGHAGVGTVVINNVPLSIALIKNLLELVETNEPSTSKIQGQLWRISELSIQHGLNWETTLDELSKFFYKTSGYTELFKELQRIKSSPEMLEFKAVYSERNAKKLRKQAVLHVFKTGALPWWIAFYSVEDFNRDLKSMKTAFFQGLQGDLLGLDLLDKQSVELLITEIFKSMSKQKELALIFHRVVSLMEGIGEISLSQLLDLRKRALSLKSSNRKELLQYIRIWIEGLKPLARVKLISLLKMSLLKNTSELIYLENMVLVSGKDPVAKQYGEAITWYGFNITEGKPNVPFKDMQKALLEGETSAVKIRIEESFTILEKFRKHLSVKENLALQNALADFLITAKVAGRLNAWSVVQWKEFLLELMKKELSALRTLNILGLVLSSWEIDNKSDKEIARSMSQNLQHIIIEGIEAGAKVIKDNEGVRKEDEKKEEADYRKLGEKEPKVLEEPIFVANAGIVILAPHLKVLFERCELMQEGKFTDLDCQMRAVHLLQYAAVGHEDYDESDEVVGKILCGLSIQDPIDMLALTKEHKETVDGLLHAVTQQWKPLQNTSVEGFRFSFLQREAKLQEEDEQFYMQVEQKSFDMLLDQLPWSIGMVKLSWMQKTLVTEWRQ